MAARLVALIERTDLHPASRHSVGFPQELAGSSFPETMPWPRVLVIEERADGVFLDRYTENGAPAGDTWHTTVEAAKEQAKAEYAGMLSVWTEVPPEVSDDKVVPFALRSAG